MSQWDTVIHLIAGGIAGTVGAVVTCPLEVVKTRLQSSSSGFNPSGNQNSKPGNYNNNTTLGHPQHNRKLCTGKYLRYSFIALSHCGVVSPSGRNPRNLPSSPGLVQCLKYIIRNEGSKALFKGLGPNLVGVAPSRAIYFCTYSQTKTFFNTCLPPDSPVVHVCSAFCAGFVASTATNPIWFVKTRLQLDHQTKRPSAIECIKKIYKKSGILGFYKGIVASYIGICETVVHFVIYEAVKAWLITHRSTDVHNADNNSKTSRDFLEFMAAGAFSKTVASCTAYPHEVARTRLREEGNKYRGFWQTLITVYNEEGPKGLYRGLSIQLVRQIPNTAIMMASYEAVVYILMRQLNSSSTNPTSKSSNQFYAETKNKGELA